MLCIPNGHTRPCAHASCGNSRSWYSSDADVWPPELVDEDDVGCVATAATGTTVHQYRPEGHPLSGSAIDPASPTRPGSLAEPFVWPELPDADPARASSLVTIFVPSAMNALPC